MEKQSFTKIYIKNIKIKKTGKVEYNEKSNRRVVIWYLGFSL